MNLQINRIKNSINRQKMNKSKDITKEIKEIQL